MRLFEDDFDIFNDELDDANNVTNLNYVPVDMTGTRGQYKTLEDLLETDTSVEVSLDIFEDNDQADLSFNQRQLADMAYFGAVYAIAAAAIEKIKANYPNGFSVLSAATSLNTMMFNAADTYTYGSTRGLPQNPEILDYVVTELDSGGTITNTFTIVQFTVIGLTYMVVELDGNPAGGTHTYSFEPTNALLSPFYATLTQYEYDLLVPPVSRSNYWPHDAITPGIIINEGSSFELFATNELNEAINIDNNDADFLWRKLYPSGQKILDNDSGIAKKLIHTFAMNFDMIHKYQEHLAYAHTIDYSDYNHIPDELVSLLASQWNWSLVKDLNQEDISEYIYPSYDNYVTGHSEQQISGKQINFERWRRILANIIYLYKKKGTEAGIRFFANIYGIPERLFFIDEIMAVDGEPTNLVVAPSKIVVHTATGRKFVVPTTGEIRDYPYQGIINTKYMNVNISPFDAIEFEYYDWGWGDHPDVLNVNGEFVSFSSLTQPYEYNWYANILQNLIPSDGMNRYDYNYPLLENEGDLYYDEAATPWSLETLQPYIDFLDDNWAVITHKLLPSASKLLSMGVLYRNQFWNRQKYQWDIRELDQKDLPFNEDIIFDHVSPVIELSEKLEQVIDLASTEASKLPYNITNLDSFNIATDVWRLSYRGPKFIIDIVELYSEKLLNIEDAYDFDVDDKISNTYESLSPLVYPITGTSTLIGTGVFNITEYSNDMIIQSMESTISIPYSAENLSDSGYTKIKLDLFEHNYLTTDLGEEEFSILNVVYETDQFGMYRLSTVDNLLVNNYIALELQTIPYLNQIVKVRNINHDTNEITTEPPIGLFGLPIGENGEVINWTTYISTGIINRMGTVYRAGGSYQAMISLLNILAVLKRAEYPITDTFWDMIILLNIVPDAGDIRDTTSIDDLIGFASFKSYLANNFGERINISTVYALATMIEKMSDESVIKYDRQINDFKDHITEYFGERITLITIQAFAKLVGEITTYISIFDRNVISVARAEFGEFDDEPLAYIYASMILLEFLKANPNYSLNDNPQELVNIMLQTHTRATFRRIISFFDWSIPVQTIEYDNVSLTGHNWNLPVIDMNSLPDTNSGTANGDILIGGLNDLNSRILKDKIEYFYTLKGITSAPSGWTEDIVGIDNYSGHDIIENGIDIKEYAGISYYGRNFTFFNRANEPHIVNQPNPAQAPYYAPLQMMAGVSAFISFRGVSDADRLEIQYYPMSGLSTYGITNVTLGGLTRGGLDRIDFYSAGSSPGNYEISGWSGYAQWLETYSSDTYGASIPLTGYAVHGEQQFEAFTKWVNYWEAGGDYGNYWDSGYPGFVDVDVFNWHYVYGVDLAGEEYFSGITDSMWTNTGLTVIVDLQEYATDGYLYQNDTTLDEYTAYWWRIRNIRNKKNLFGFNLEIFTPTEPQILVTGPDATGGGGAQSGEVPDTPRPPLPGDDSILHG